MSMLSHAWCVRVCVYVCVCVLEKDLDERLCVCVRAHERVHHNEKKVPDKIATTASDTSDTSRNVCDGSSFQWREPKSMNYQAGTKDSQKLNSISNVCERLFHKQGTRPT